MLFYKMTFHYSTIPYTDFYLLPTPYCPLISIRSFAEQHHRNCLKHDLQIKHQ
jgi:hypothetical protein